MALVVTYRIPTGSGTAGPNEAATLTTLERGCGAVPWMTL